MYLCFRSMSVLSGGSLTSQSSRRSAQSLYKWKKKWSQESRNRSDTRSPTPLLSQSKLDQSHNTSLLSQSHTGHLSNLISQTAARSEVNTSLFSDDEDEEEWMQAICSDQVSRCYPIHKSLVREKFHTFQFCRVNWLLYLSYYSIVHHKILWAWGHIPLMLLVFGVWKEASYRGGHLVEPSGNWPPSPVITVCILFDLVIIAEIEPEWVWRALHWYGYERCFRWVRLQ